MQLSRGSDRVTDYFKAPGKLFIAGEYAVVEPGHGAIVAAVSATWAVTIDESTECRNFNLTQNPDVIVEWTRERRQFCTKADHPYGPGWRSDFGHKQYVRETGTPTNALYSLSIGELDDAKRGIKYGSSGPL